MVDTRQGIIDKAIILSAYEMVVAEVFVQAAAWRHENPDQFNHSIDEVIEAAAAFDELTKSVAINRLIKIRDKLDDLEAAGPDDDGDD